MFKKGVFRFIIALIGVSFLNNAIAQNYNGFYLEGNVGYLTTDWQHSGLFPNITVPSFSLTFNSFKRSHGGFIYGMDGGYLINRYVGFEVGGYILPTVNANYTIQTVPATIIQGTDNINSWLVYSAAKFIIPTINRLDIFLKIGAGYRNVAFRGRDQHNNNLDLNGLSFIGGAGLQYFLSPLFTVEAQWLRVNGYPIISQQNVSIPLANLFMAGIIINLNHLSPFPVP